MTEYKLIETCYRGDAIPMWVQKRSRSDPDQIKEVFEEDVYGPILEQIVMRNAIVVDVGAYIGDTMVLFHWWKAKKIYAFEPHPILYKLAVKNAKTNGVHYWAKPVGLSDTNKTIDVPGRPTRSFGHGKAPFLDPKNPKHHQRIHLTAARPAIRRILAIHKRIRLLKIDAEGYETRILPNVGIQLRCVDNLVVECHGVKRFAEVTSYLNKIGMKIVGRYNAQPTHHMDTIHATW